MIAPELELEAAPRVYSDVASDADGARLRDWLRHTPTRREFCALGLARQERGC